MVSTKMWLLCACACACVCVCMCVCVRVCKRERVSFFNNRIACLLRGHQSQSLLFSLPFYHLSIHPLTNRPMVQWTDAKNIVPVCLLTHKATLSFLTLSTLLPNTDLKGLGFSMAAESISLESVWHWKKIIKLYWILISKETAMLLK